MTYRRRHRWLRRLALGLAFAAFASPAAAKFDEGGNGNRYVTAGGWSGLVDPDTGVPLSAGIGADLATGTPIHGEDVASKAAVHHSIAGSEQAGRGTSVAWDDGVSLAIGGIVLALVLGLGFAYVKRPRLAGL
ncbi:MAG TPA: hypothetical protein VML35_07080 [Gaiellaceae bacterium]|nr:hypothetical protein [Gaiellaceae bacterium]